MTDKKRNIIHLLEYSILLMFCFSVLRGEVIALGGYIDTEDDENHGNHAVPIDDRNPVHGYINAYTNIEITVILTQEHTALNGNPFVTYLGFATEGSLPVTDFTNNMEIGGDHAGAPVFGQFADVEFDHDGDGVDDYKKTYTITRDQIKQDNTFDPDVVQYVDFEVEWMGVRYSVDWTDGTTKTYLKFDDSPPTANVKYWRAQSWLDHNNDK